MTIRFVSWNVNGFRAVLKKGFMASLEVLDPDVISLQEIRCLWEEVDLGVRRELESSFDICWFPAQSRKGYSGSATLSRKGLGFVHEKGIGLDDFDREGRLIESALEQLTFLSGYFPNASTGLARLDFKREFARRLAERVGSLHSQGRTVILAGDMNVAPEEIDLARPKDNVQNPGFTLEEREDFRLYLNSGLVDILRERNPDVPGLYTWWSQRGMARAKNIGWRIDHFLVSRSLCSSVEDVSIHSDISGSDHCPLSLTIKDR